MFKADRIKGDRHKNIGGKNGVKDEKGIKDKIR